MNKFAVFSCFVIIISVLAPAYAQENIPNLTVRGVKPLLSPSKYSKFYTENDAGQQVYQASISSMLGMSETSITYQLYLPKNFKEDKAYPLVMLLHGANRTGKSVAERWKKTADEVGLILVAPNAYDNFWMNGKYLSVYTDLFEKIVADMSSAYPIDKRRIYLFGHSNGAMMATIVPYYKPNLFTAIALHAGKIPEPFLKGVPEYKTKVPFLIQIGTRDSLFPLATVKQSAELLAMSGHPTVLEVYKGHNHWYYSLAPQINRNALAFFLSYKKQG